MAPCQITYEWTNESGKFDTPMLKIHKYKTSPTRAFIRTIRIHLDINKISYTRWHYLDEQLVQLDDLESVEVHVRDLQYGKSSGFEDALGSGLWAMGRRYHLKVFAGTQEFFWKDLLQPQMWKTELDASLDTLTLSPVGEQIRPQDKTD